MDKINLYLSVLKTDRDRHINNIEEAINNDKLSFMEFVNIMNSELDSVNQIDSRLSLFVELIKNSTDAK